MANNLFRSTGPVLKAATVHLRRDDPLSIPVERRIATAEDHAYRGGYEAGFAAGAAQAGADLAVAGERLRISVGVAVADHAQKVRADRQRDAERLVKLSLRVAEWAVRRELSSVPEAFFARLAEVLADRHHEDRVEIFTSPGLAASTRQWLDDATIAVTAANDLADGEARVLLGDTTVFATFEDAFERARQALERSLLDHADGDQVDGDQVDGDMADEVVEVLYDATVDGAW